MKADKTDAATIIREHNAIEQLIAATDKLLMYDDFNHTGKGIYMCKACGITANSDTLPANGRCVNPGCRRYIARKALKAAKGEK